MQNIYRSYRKYLTERFGGPVLKIPINGGFSCPNRDGTLGTQGCHFCDNRAFSPAANVTVSPELQLKSAIEKAGKRFTHYIPYLQPFSNTYGSVEQCQAIYEPLIRIPGVVGIAIGTRPDCFAPGMVEYIGELSDRVFVSVELGLQSSSNATLAHINRGHTFEQFLDIVNQLAKYSVELVVHCILGLPNETINHTIDTAKKLASLPISGVKLHQLMITPGTVFEQWFTEGKVQTLSLKEYAMHVGEFLNYLRPDQYIHRIMADSSPQCPSIAPEWCLNKMKAREEIHSYLRNNGFFQGKKFSQE